MAEYTADTADGIVIKTSLDTSGIDQGIKEIEDKIRNMSRVTAKAGEGVKAEFGVTSNELESMLTAISDKFELLIIDVFASLTDVISEQFDKAGERAEDFQLEVIQGLSDGIVEAAESMERLERATETAGDSVRDVYNIEVVNNIKDAAENTDELADSMQRVSRRSVSFGSAFRRIGAVLKGIVGHFGNLINRLKSAGSGILRFIKNFVGIAALANIVQRAFNKIKSAMSVLADSETAAGHAIQDFQAALDTMNNSIAAAFAPIAEVVLPILTRFIEYLTEIISKIGQIVAALTGKDTFTKATKVQAKYAQELNNTAAAAKNAQKSLAGFDDINILKDDRNNGAGGPGSMFEEVPIAEGIGDLADRIRGYFERGDWDGLGEEIAKKINEFFQKIKDAISWDNVGEKITKVVNAITTTFNSLVDKVDFGLIGATFAEGVNTIIKTLDLLITGVNWKRLGEQFGNLVLGFADTVDWDAFAQLIADGISGAFDLVSGFTSRLNKGDLAGKLANAINLIVDRVNKEHVGEKVGSIISDCIEMGFTFLAGIDYGNILVSIYTFVTDLLKSIRVDDIAEKISDFIVNVLSSFAHSLSQISLIDLVTEIQNLSNRLLSEIRWGDIALELIRFITVLMVRVGAELPMIIIKSLLAPIELAFRGIQQMLDWAGLGDKINVTGWIDKMDEGFSQVSDFVGKGIEEFNTGFDYLVGKFDDMNGHAVDSMSSLGNTVENAFSGVGTSIFNHTSQASENYSWFLDRLKVQTGEKMAEVVREYEVGGQKLYEITLENGEKRTVTEQEYLEKYAAIVKLQMENIVGVVDENGKKMIEVTDGAGNSMLMTYDEVLSNADEKTRATLETILSGYDEEAWATREKTEEIAVSYDDFMERMRQKTQDEMYDSVDIVETSTGKMVYAVTTDGDKMVMTYDDYLKSLDEKTKFTMDDIVAVYQGDGELMFEIMDKEGNKTLASYTDMMKNMDKESKKKLASIVNTYKNAGWGEIGANIVNGIEAGIHDNWYKLTAQSQQKAAQLKRNYADALMIQSPSKLFRDEIGKMIPLGIAEGIDAETDSVLRTIDSTANAMYNEAESAISMPSMSLGGVVPYAVSVESDSIQTTLDNLAAALSQNDKITRDELYAILVELFREYLRIDLWIGDEQVARHAQTGAMKINRRLSPVEG